MSGNDEEPQMQSSPYATGGGGTVLEHRYGATLLCSLLTGDPVPGLGDDVVPVSVHFQASAVSPVDDLVATGQMPDGAERRLSIGVRRSPEIVKSDATTVALLISYLRILADHWGEVMAGRWRLGLAVASPNPATQQIGELSTIARAAPSEEKFREAVVRPGRTRQAVRQRLGHVDALVADAAEEAEVDPGIEPRTLSWRLLSALRVQELRLEGSDETDRTIAVSRLRTLTADGVAADRLFAQMAELAGRYASAGAEVTQLLLRRDLSGIPVGRSPSRRQAWEILAGLAERLQDRTRDRLTDSQTELRLDRAEEQEALAHEMKIAAAEPGTLLVLGEPEVGKSALTLQVASQIDKSAVAVTALSLRDLPKTTVEFESLLGGRLADVLGSTATGAGRLLIIDGVESVLEGWRPLFADITTAAVRAGLGVVAVSRDEGSSEVDPSVAKTRRDQAAASSTVR